MLKLREAESRDAAEVGALIAEFQGYLRGLGDRTEFRFGADAYRRDGFGPNRAFQTIVAEANSRIVGYLMYQPGYDTDRAMRQIFLIDLYVQENHREEGVGRALMERAAEIGRGLGAGELVWTVFKANEAAFRFYEKLGARYLRDLEFMALEIL